MRFYRVSKYLPGRQHVNQVIKDSTLSIETNRYRASPDQMQWKGSCISSVKFSQKFIISVWSRGNIRQTQTENHSAKWLSWIIKKNVKVMKIREKRRSNSRAKRTREIRQLSDPGWGPLAREGITGTDHWIKDTQELFALALQHLYAWNCFKRKEYKYHLLLEDCWSLPFVASGPCSNFGCLVQFVYSSAFPLDCELLEFLDWALFISISLEPRQWPKHRKHS